MANIKSYGELLLLASVAYAVFLPAFNSIIELGSLYLPTMFVVGLGLYVLGIVEDYNPGDSR